MISAKFILAIFIVIASQSRTEADHSDSHPNSHSLGDNVEYRPGWLEMILQQVCEIVYSHSSLDVLGTCLMGDKHLTEPRPEPETEEHVACHQWRDSACCTPEFTKQLAQVFKETCIGQVLY